MSIYDRRRTAIAALITLVALPALFWAKKSDPIASAAVASADAGGALAAATGADGAGAENAADTPPGFLSGPVDTAAFVPNEPVGPPADETFTRAGLGTYKTFEVDAVRLCNVTFVPAGTRITVENTDNGKRIECLVERARLPAGMIIVLDSTLFAQLSDLAEAPIPVRIRW